MSGLTPEQPKRSRFPFYLRVRAPRNLALAVEAIADEQMTTSSEYIRQAIIARLRSDGVKLSQHVEAA